MKPESERRQPRRVTGRLGHIVYVIVDRKNVSQYVGLARWEVDYMMRENNGRGRGWTVRRFVEDR